MTHEEETIALLRSIEKSLAGIADAMTKLANPPMIVNGTLADNPASVRPAGYYVYADGPHDFAASYAAYLAEQHAKDQSGIDPRGRFLEPFARDYATPMNLHAAPGLSK